MNSAATNLQLCLGQSLFIPNTAQPPAVVLDLECCASDSTSRRLGNCFSGPGNLHAPDECQTQVTCSAGFSTAVQEGDFAHLLCEAELPGNPEDDGTLCEGWLDPETPANDSCPAASARGVTSFSTFDADGDGDLDLLDYADFQNSI